ncbi:hypothetical protein [Spirobacillus cienkowskii]|uniref:hypothetical protein n=1 Tax=Spirobacillus cienkowskii TaxID=495820 RepID=UPI0030CF55AA
MPLTSTNLYNTLNYWWGLDEHKNTLINWQRYNTRETLINNRNRVYNARREIIEKLSNTCGAIWRYYTILNATLSHSLLSQDTNSFQDQIQYNLPHQVFINWVNNHQSLPHGNHGNCRHSPLTDTYLSNFGSIPFLPEHSPIPAALAMPLDNRTTVSYTAKIKEDTLNYWWGLEGHKNTLITWQRENNQDVLQTNKNTVHTERLRLINLLLNDTFPPYAGMFALNAFYHDNHDYGWQKHPNSSTKYTLDAHLKGILLNVPHNKFNDWVIGHKQHVPSYFRKFTENNYSSYLTNFGSTPFLPDDIILPEYTITSEMKTDTLTHWWGVTEHKNNLITWQRQNSKDTLQANTNTVHTERLRLISLLLDDTFPPQFENSALNGFYKENLEYGAQKHPNSSTKYVLDLNLKNILLNVPHSKFNDWLMGHKKYSPIFYRQFTENNYLSYLTDFGSLPFLPEEVLIPEYKIFNIKELKEALAIKVTTTPIFISYRLDALHPFTKGLQHFAEGILDKLKNYTIFGCIVSDSLTPAQCNALIAELKITKPVEYSPRLTVGKLKQIAEHTLYNESTPLSEFFIVGENLLVTGEGYSKPQVGDLQLEFLIQAVPN